MLAGPSLSPIQPPARQLECSFLTTAAASGTGSQESKHGRRRSVDRTAFPLSNETEVEESQEENDMDNGARAADLRRRGKARAQDRHRNAGQVEIEENPGAHEEGACKELAHVLPRNPPEHARMLWTG